MCDPIGERRSWTVYSWYDKRRLKDRVHEQRSQSNLFYREEFQ